jgi:hypothetical protein
MDDDRDHDGKDNQKTIRLLPSGMSTSGKPKKCGGGGGGGVEAEAVVWRRKAVEWSESGPGADATHAALETVGLGGRGRGLNFHWRRQKWS